MYLTTPQQYVLSYVIRKRGENLRRNLRKSLKKDQNFEMCPAYDKKMYNKYSYSIRRETLAIYTVSFKNAFMCCFCDSPN
jgi:23S rRNA maturation-related 3'-5' exoribonuclease YhaM